VDVDLVVGVLVLDEVVEQSLPRVISPGEDVLDLLVDGVNLLEGEHFGLEDVLVADVV